ncbi:hypothetical protein [Sabulicella glaciei]|uniref:Uncharacterized protein n=1 Tax=Sabulicella glaciei TaxID=2984948 RepID=A0ABT3NSX6_9PROT|nr:hypothetical protein [Roseococcus sp. MDT2-1-1]MCW8085272.1 hypothetical protein [Roseococcus sp. MDT2-1-1]
MGGLRGGRLEAKDVAAKLRLTTAALGISGQKELCAAFRRVNPDTDFDLDRSYKWMQARSQPRSAQVYDDWAAVCGLRRPGAWVAASSLGEFAAALGARHGLDPAVLRRRAGLEDDAAPTASQRAAAGTRDEHYLIGAYACFSHAQSPYYCDRIVRGALALGVAPQAADGEAAPGLVAQFSQALPSGLARISGPAFRGAGRALTLSLHEDSSAGASPVCFSLVLPAPPGSLIAGIMSGFTMIDPAGQPPYATRVAMVRVPAPIATVAATGGYMDPAPLSLARELATLGLVIADPAGFEALLTRFLSAAGEGRPGTARVPMDEQAALAAACDRAWFDTLAARGSAAAPEIPAPALRDA